MSDGIQAPSGRSGGFRIRNQQDFYGGLVLVAVAAFALWASRDLPGMRGFAFGPGTAPRIFASILGALGLIVAVGGLVTDGPPVERVAVRGTALGAVLIAIFILVSNYATPITAGLGLRQYETVLAAIVVLLVTIAIARGADRGPLYVVAGTLVFAGTIRPLGLVLASFISIVVCAAATVEVRWRETILWAAGLTIFCALLFVYALNLPFNFWPRF
ncbi:MAG: tripartite tricarboxylate transporter TctB family protein [Xanthobacteraceae bacterium]|nr:tripartite tricarboxylate transporter TctB family protein [Xanthobacteraceae bacterium]MBV9631781.1 tripartite tricarboxylate transporter TctB family protein [Xanthobacteraceae bacterium]